MLKTRDQITVHQQLIAMYTIQLQMKHSKRLEQILLYTIITMVCEQS